MVSDRLLTPSSGDKVARGLGLALSAVALLAIAWAFAFSDIAGAAPAYALGSELVYRLERAVGATLLLAIPCAVIAPLLTGRLPKSVGREGVDWGEQAVAETERIARLERTVDRLQEDLAAFSRLEAAGTAGRPA